MKTIRTILAALFVLAVVVGALPARAVGPVDGEVTVLYWDSTTDAQGASEGSGNAGGRAELWFLERWGVSGSYFRPSPGGALSGTDLETTDLDLKFRLLSPSRENFVAIGAGWQKLDVSGDVSGSASGPRIVAEGRFSIKIVYLFARAAYAPELGDLTLGSDRYKNGSGQQLEAGVQVKPLPFFQIFAGYRADKATFDAPEGGTASVENKGPFAGVGFNF
jgi:hypothetical protein